MVTVITRPMERQVKQVVDESKAALTPSRKRRPLVHLPAVLSPGLALCVLAYSLDARADATETLVYNVPKASSATSLQQNPIALTQGTDAALYGISGGATGQAIPFDGSVFSLAMCASYSYRTVAPFTAGEEIISGVVEGPDGALYGSVAGKTGARCTRVDNGLLCGDSFVFRVSKAGKLDILHTFDQSGSVGGPVLVAADLTVYGTTYYGGVTTTDANGLGVVYKIDSTGAYSIVYDFGTDGGQHGRHPQSRLVRDADGNLYGTCAGDRLAPGTTPGTVFKITPSGTLSILASFNGGTVGSLPSNLLLAKNGKLYGMARGGDGSVFELPLSGNPSKLHSLLAATDGGVGNASASLRFGIEGANSLIEGADGKLYGIADAAGPGGYGTLFSLVPNDGTFSVVYSFKGGSDGGTPVSVVQVADGSFYGTVLAGGANSNLGGIFRVDLTSPPSLEACSTGGVSGTGGSGSGGAAHGGATASGGVPDGGASGNSGGAASASGGLDGTSASGGAVAIGGSSAELGGAPSVAGAGGVPEGGEGGVPTEGGAGGALGGMVGGAMGVTGGSSARGGAAARGGTDNVSTGGSDSGCGCAVVGARRYPIGLAVYAGLALAVLRRRRRASGGARDK
ncbi:MAG: MYXO-CTERM sorting domain-containing protein [Polyangiaceae bacterium]